jgi:hypothetical protein
LRRREKNLQQKKRSARRARDPMTVPTAIPAFWPAVSLEWWVVLMLELDMAVALTEAWVDSVEPEPGVDSVG